MLNIWTKKSGSSLGTFQERTIVNIGLPTTFENTFEDSTDLSFSVITGKLPPGLRISEGRIVGSAFEVPRITEFRFVIRARYNGEVSDRTFSITIEGEDVPVWQTAAGSLPIGTNQAYYVLDSSYIDFQLDVVDFDTAAGQRLKFSIPSKGGELPPGLILTETGRIVGWVQPTLAPPLKEGNGTYDNQRFDTVAFDYGIRPSNGYDSFIFDIITFDYSIPSTYPKKLNRNFEFNVIVTDGENTAIRKFRIYVVGDDFFRADNTVTRSGNGTFTADITYARAPIWETPSYLGIVRANNYKTFKLDTYEGLYVGPIDYNLETINPDVSGLAQKVNLDENKKYSNLLRIQSVQGTPIEGHKIRFSDLISGTSTTIKTITNVLKISNTEYVLTVGDGGLPATVFNGTVIYLGTLSILPPGMQFDQSTGEAFGVLPYQPAITKNYKFSVKATRYTDRGETASSIRTFNVDIIGEIDGAISWNTSSNLGSVGAEYVSTLFVKATTTASNSLVVYRLTSGKLPPGLTLNLNGEFIGKVNQFSDTNTPGLTRFYDSPPKVQSKTFTTFDGDTTTVDRSYQFTIEARDILGISAITRTFSLVIDTPNDRKFSNIYVKPFLKQTQRSVFKDFISNPEIFDISAIYRPDDPNFGIQTELKMLVYAGIETKDAAAVVGMAGRNHKIKRFKFGEVKKAVAYTPETFDAIYETVYLEMFDPLEKGKTHLNNIISTSYQETPITTDQTGRYFKGPFDLDLSEWAPPNPLYVTADRNDLLAGDPKNGAKFPSSLAIWRKRIAELGIKDRNFLPLWMRSIQSESVQELGYVKAIPLCFCKVGRADDIVLNIKYSQFNFKQIDYQIDRYIIDAVNGYFNDKYIVFRNDRTTIS